MTRKKAAILVSGSGTNMENIAKHARAGKLDLDIVLIICDNPNAFALKRAEKLGLNVFLIDRKQFKTKTEFDAAMTAKLKEKKVDVVLLAGFMRILGAEFVRDWQGRLINIHPSFLPKFPGAHAIRDAFEAKEKETGVTVHFVVEEVDSGPVILQRKVPIHSDDTLETLETRVHALEYEIYPEAIKLFLTRKGDSHSIK